MGEKFERYDPSIHSSSIQYIHNYGNTEYEHAACHFAINGIFTPLVAKFAEHAALDLASGDIPALNGSEPVSIPYQDKFMDIFATINELDLPQFKNYLNVEPVGNIASVATVLPINESYGEEYSKALARTTRALYTTISQTMRPEAAKVDIEHRRVIFEETYPHNSLHSIAEGVYSTAVALSLLVAEKVPGYEDPFVLSRQLAEDGVVLHLAASSPPNVLVPLVLRGSYLPGIVIAADSLRLSDDVLTLFEKERALDDGKEGPNERNEGCGLARANTPYIDENGQRKIIKESGVQMAAEVFVDYLDYFSTHPELDVAS